MAASWAVRFVERGLDIRAFDTPGARVEDHWRTAFEETARAQQRSEDAYRLMLDDGPVRVNEMGLDFRVAIARDTAGQDWVLRIPRRRSLECRKEVQPCSEDQGRGRRIKRARRIGRGGPRPHGPHQRRQLRRAPRSGAGSGRRR